MITKKIIATFFTIFALVGFTAPSYAEAPIYTGTFSNKALKGFDTVSYFQNDGVPVKGSTDFTTNWRGAEWLFSSKENLEKFIANPEEYAPQYGGYCAWATAHGTLAKGDPNVYHLNDGKLYLNYDKKINQSWLPRKAELIEKADNQYPDLVDIK